MALPLMAVSLLARYLLKKGGMKLAKEYAKKNKVRITEQLVKAARIVNKGTKPTVKGGRGGPSKVKSNKKTKINANKNEGKPNKNKNTKPKEEKPKEPKPKKPKTTTGTNKPVTGTTKPGTKSFLGKGAAIGGGLVGAALLIKSKSKDKDNKSKSSNAPGGKSSSTKANAPGGMKMDDMLDSKQVRSAPSGFKNKGSKGRGASAFGNNVSFTSKDVKTLRENAKMLKNQIDGLDITSMQKLRLKKVIDTREKGYSMDESYRRAFNTVKKRVKDNKLNFAIDVSGYAGNRTD